MINQPLTDNDRILIQYCRDNALYIFLLKRMDIFNRELGKRQITLNFSDKNRMVVEMRIINKTETTF